MNRIATCIVAAGMAAAADATAHGAVVGVNDSTAPWLGFMNVFELPANGGAYVFSSGWGVPDLVASFDNPNSTLTLSPNTVNDTSPFWYIGGGGPGAAGNKIMEANLYIETTGVYSGQTVTFEGSVVSNSFTAAHQASIFVRDFAPDYSTVNEVTIPLTPGAFSLSLNTINDPARHVQWGFQVKGVNVWSTDTGPFGNAVITTIPAPAGASVLAIGGLLAARRRRVG